MNPARIASIDWKFLKMLWSMMRLIFKTSSVTPEFFQFPPKSQTKSARASWMARFSTSLKKRGFQAFCQSHIGE